MPVDHVVVGHIKWPEDRCNALEGAGKVKMRINQSCSLLAVASLLLVGWLERSAGAAGPRLRLTSSAPASVIFRYTPGSTKRRNSNIAVTNYITMRVLGPRDTRSIEL